MTWTLTARDAALHVRRSEVEGPNSTETVVEWSGHGHDGASTCLGETWPCQRWARVGHAMRFGNAGGERRKRQRSCFFGSGPSQWFFVFVFANLEVFTCFH